jgi:hypothetical protein
VETLLANDGILTFAAEIITCHCYSSYHDRRLSISPQTGQPSLHPSTRHRRLPLAIHSSSFTTFFYSLFFIPSILSRTSVIQHHLRRTSGKYRFSSHHRPKEKAVPRDLTKPKRVCFTVGPLRARSVALPLHRHCDQPAGATGTGPVPSISRQYVQSIHHHFARFCFNPGWPRIRWNQDTWIA